MVTIHDVARAAGVSITTVSRSLALPDRVAEATRTRVIAAAQELGYTPNRAAAGLRAGRRSTIGLLVPDLSNPYFAAVSRGIARRARDRRIAVFVTDSQEDAGTEVDLLRELVRQTDGVVLCSPRAAQEDQEVVGDAPLVVVNHELPGAVSIALDDHEGATQALTHLSLLGHRQIAYVGGPSRSWSDARRRSALVDATQRLPDVEILDLGVHEPTVDGGTGAADRVVASGASAVITFNDVMAVGLIRRLHRLGLRVPDDLSVIGCDDTFLASLVTPTLTSVHGDLDELGARAAELLLDAIDRGAGAGAAETVLLPACLVERESTAPHPARRRTTPTAVP